MSILSVYGQFAHLDQPHVQSKIGYQKYWSLVLNLCQKHHIALSNLLT